MINKSTELRHFCFKDQRDQGRGEVSHYKMKLKKNKQSMRILLNVCIAHTISFLLYA